MSTPSISRRNMLKLLGAGGLAAVGVPGLTGCGSSSGGGGGDVTYRIWSAQQLPTMRRLAAAFHGKHAKSRVSVQVTPNDTYWTKLEAAASSKTLPDVFWMHANQFVLYASSGMLEPIDDVVKSAKIDLSDYPKVLLDLYVHKGRRYALPRNYNVVGLWYNKRLFDKAGVEYPDGTWTWDTMRHAAKELTNASAGVHGFAATMYDQTGYWNAIYQNDGRVISADMHTSGYDDPATIEALDWWTSFILKDKSSPTAAQMAQTDPFAMFQSGKVAMLYDGDWESAPLAQDEKFAEGVGVAVLPKGRRRASIIHGSGNVIAADTGHMDTAKELVGFLASKQAQDIQSKGGASGPPAALSNVQTWLDANKTFDLSTFRTEVAYGVLYPHSRNTQAWLDLETKHLTPAWTGKTDVETAAKALAADMNKVLAKEHE